MLKTMLLLALLAQPERPTAAVQPGLQPVPHPSLAGLDPEVASQIEDARTLVDGLLAQNGADVAERDKGKVAEAYGEVCKLYHAYGMTDAAMPCYANAIRLQPVNVAWSYYLGLLQQETGKMAEAEASYRRVLASFTDFHPARIHLGEVLLAGNRPEEAEAEFRQVLAKEPGNAAAQAVLGEVLLSRRQYAEAVKSLEGALAAAPGADRLHHPLGLAWRGLGDMDKAREHLEKAGRVGVRPADSLVDEMESLRQGPTVHLLRGRMAFRFGRYADAAAEFRKTVAAHPESVPARINLAAALGETGDRKGAKQQLREALALAPDNATAHFNLGTLSMQDGETAGAVVHFREAVRIEPADAMARRLLAQELEKDGRPEEALDQLEVALGIEPQSQLTWMETAGLFLRLGRFREARATLETADGNLPGDRQIRWALAKLLADSPDASLRDGRRALALAEQLYKEYSSPYNAQLLALALAETGDCPGAAQWQRKALDVMRQTGQTPETVQTMEAVLKSYQAEGTCRPSVLEKGYAERFGEDLPPVWQ